MKKHPHKLVIRSIPIVGEQYIERGGIIPSRNVPKRNDILCKG